MGNSDIIALFPQLSGHGGVQRLGRHMLYGLDHLARRQGMNLVALSLLDEKGVNKVEVADHSIRYTGYGGSRISMAMDFHRHGRHGRIVWIAHPFLSPLLLLPASGRNKWRSIIHAHGIEVWEPLPRLRRIAMQAADLLTSSSRYTADKLIELQGMERGRVHVLHPALDPNLLGKKSKNESEQAVLIVSRMNQGDREKGVELGLNAFSEVAKEHQEWVCHVVGDGDDRKRLEGVAKASIPPGRITFHGKVSDEHLVNLYESCGIFCLPSTKEGFGIVYLEAMTRGMAILALDATAVPEVISHNRTGLLSKPGDVQGLADNLRRLVTDEELRKHLGENAANDVQRFRLEQFQQRMDSILEPLLEAAT